MAAQVAAGFIIYRTVYGDRWDLIAWNMYGDPTEYAIIIAANPNVPISPVLPQGLDVAVPLIVSGSQAAATLQPWQRLTS